MAVRLKSFIDRLTPSSSRRPSRQGTPSGEFVTAPKGKLFPATDPAIDGDDCLHDCASCSIHYPPKFEIDQDDTIYGNVGQWDTHILVATGKTDWVRDVEDEKGSVMQAIGKSSVKPNGKLKLSASNMPVHHPSATPMASGTSTPTGNHHDTSTVILLPAFVCIDNVTPSNVQELITNFINQSSTTTTPLPTPHETTITTSDTLETTDPTSPTFDASTAPSLTLTTLPPPPPPPTFSTLTSRPCPHKYLILLCSQKTRDARCGQSAPLLRREFERHLRPLGLHRDLADERPGGCGIYFISHVGGHKYSANVMIYRRDDEDDDDEKKEDDGEASQCIWLARVRPEDCENIVRYTLLQGKVVKPTLQLRGGFDRARGLVSW